MTGGNEFGASPLDSERSEKWGKSSGESLFAVVCLCVSGCGPRDPHGELTRARAMPKKQEIGLHIAVPLLKVRWPILDCTATRTVYGFFTPLFAQAYLFFSLFFCLCLPLHSLTRRLDMFADTSIRRGKEHSSVEEALTAIGCRLLRFCVLTSAKLVAKAG